MADTKIEWAEKVWNPVTGCTKVSAGCMHCYAERMAFRLQGRAGYPKTNPFDVTLHSDKLDEPLKWKSPQRVFICSMGDLFHEKVPFWFIDEVFATILEAVQHTFLILTKRPARMREYFEKFRQEYLPIQNIWLGTSVENQRAAEKRIPELLNIPAVVRFLSCEPLLGPLELDEIPQALFSVEKDENSVFQVNHSKINWVIVGGESGPGARLMDDEWVLSLKDQCAAGNIPFFFKQWGEWVPQSQMQYDGYANVIYANIMGDFYGKKSYWRLGKKLASNWLNGEKFEEYPDGVK
jgi:protein gp37